MDCQRDNLLTAAGEEWVSTDKKCTDKKSTGTTLPHRRESGVDLVRSTGIKDKQLPTERARAASCTSLTMRAASGSFGFTTRANTVTFGTISCRSPNALPPT